MHWLDTMRTISTQASFKKGEIVYLQGAKDQQTYMLLSGTVALCVNKTQVYSVGPGALFGLVSALDGGDREMTAIATLDCVTLVLDAQALRQLCGASTDFFEYLTTALAGTTRTLVGALAAPTDGSEVEDVAPELISGSEAAAHNSILPSGHPTYSISGSELSVKLVHDKAFVCPICQQNFVDQTPLSFKLKTREVTYDMRTIYEGLEILWHSVRVCPHCNTAAPTGTFAKLTARDARQLKASGYAAKYPPFCGWTSPRTVDQVFQAFYLALHCLDMSSKDVLVRAQIWRRLMWLYGDVADESRQQDAARKTLGAYQEVYRVKTLAGEEEQQVNIILGDLYQVHNDRSNAYRHYMNVVQLGKTANPLLYAHATDAIADLRAER